MPWMQPASQQKEIEMNTKNKVLTTLALLALPVMAQERLTHEVSVQGTGNFLKSTTENGIRQSADNKAGVLASYRLFFNAHHGIEANYGFVNNTQSYGNQAGTIAGLKTNTHEVSAAYVVRFPLKRVTPFALAGAGALMFDARDAGKIDTQSRAAFIYGGGADIHLSSHFFVRAAYRGLVYNSPTYKLAALEGADRVTHRAQPSVGFGYRF
jgi:opacity protein-like surface antigen